MSNISPFVISGDERRALKKERAMYKQLLNNVYREADIWYVYTGHQVPKESINDVIDQYQAKIDKIDQQLKQRNDE